MDEEQKSEILDLIAEAARKSTHAGKAYALLQERWHNAPRKLEGRQELIAGRMDELA